MDIQKFIIFWLLFSIIKIVNCQLSKKLEDNFLANTCKWLSVSILVIFRVNLRKLSM